MVWMLDPHADQILRGLYKEQDRSRWKTWLRYGAVVIVVGITAGATFLKLRPSAVPIAPVATEPAAKPATTITFPSLLSADLPQAGWRNPEVEKMRSLLRQRPLAAKLATAHRKRSAAHN
jgi:hypothetical protein